MNDLRDPRRLRARAAPGSVLERGLAGARERGPSDAQLRALNAALFGAVAAGNVTRTLKTGMSGLRLMGLVTMTAVVVAAGAAGLAWRHHRTDPPAVSQASPVVVASPAPAPAVVALEPPAPVARRATPAVIQRKHAPAARVSIERPSDQGADEELALIGAAERALAVDPARALALVREHERRYPDGLLGQEREVIAVSALWGIGRRAQAQQRAARFTAEHPGSTYIARLQRIVAAPGGALINEAATDHQHAGGQ